MNQAVKDAINDAKEVFWGDDSIEVVLLDLAKQITWRSNVETYEFISLLLDKTGKMLHQLKNNTRAFWEPVLRYNFDLTKDILQNDTDKAYDVLAQYFPLPTALNECKEILSGLNSLVTLYLDVDGMDKGDCRKMGIDLYNELIDRFRAAYVSSRYMSCMSSMEVYRQILLNGLTDLTALEISSNKKAAKASKATQQAPKAPAKEVAQAPAQPAPQPQPQPQPEAQPKAQAVEKAGGQPSNKESTAPVEVTPEMVEEVTIQAKPADYIPPENRVNMNDINKLIDGTGFSLKGFIEQFQLIESQYYFGIRHNDTEAVNFFVSVLGDMFVSFDKQYKIMINTKPQRGGLKPDLAKWAETQKHIECFKNKAQLK